MQTSISLLRLAQVEERTGLKRSKIYQMMGSRQFPSPIKLGKRSVRWPSNSIDSWIESITALNPKTVEVE
jgi:prophage regulatory protein